MPRSTCLTPDELAAFSLGDLSDEALEEMAEHLEKCARCEAAARALDGISDPMLVAFRRSAQAIPLEASNYLPGQVGDYEILGEIGRGGMGIVYRARHLQLDRMVALKMLLGGAMADGNERARFRAEAGAVARLQHPNIVQIYEIGECEVDTGLPRPYFTLEFVDGGNLSDLIGGRPQPPRAAASRVETLARAAHYAHENGIVHRDLKPSNVLLTREGQPKICDFGVAKLLTESDVKTLSGTLLGTVEYMAPEQASGETTVGPAADIYALGAILYTALTGHPPFQGPNTLTTLEQVRRQEPVPARRLQPNVPRDLDTICLKCLEKEPGKRYASAHELAEDLRRFLADEPIRARRASLWERSARWIRRNKAIALATGLAIGTLIGATAFSAVAAIQKEVERQRARTAEQEAVAAQQRAESARALAERQRELALRNLYVAKTNLMGMTLENPGGSNQLAQLLNEWRGFPGKEDPRGWEWYYCQTLARQDEQTLRGHSADASALAWSPDGSRIASGGFDNTIRIWEASSGKQLLSFVAPWGIMALSWDREGQRLASADWSEKTVTTWDPSVGRKLATFRGHEQPVTDVAFSLDGERLASADEKCQVIVWDATTAEPLLKLSGQGSPNAAVSWSPDGRLLAGVMGDVVMLWDGRTGEPSGKLPGRPGHTLSSVRWSPDGTTLAAVAPGGRIDLWDAATKHLRRSLQADAEGFAQAIAWSPDSRFLAVGCGDLALRVWDVQSGMVVRTFQGHTGSRLANVCWRFDGRALASAERGWNGEIKVWKFSPPSKEQNPVPEAGDEGGQARWSLDGKMLAFARRDRTVAVREVSTGKLLATLRGPLDWPSSLSWSPDGRTIATAGDDGVVRLWESGSGRLLSMFPSQAGVIDMSWSHDSRNLAVSTKSQTLIYWDVGSASRRALRLPGGPGTFSPVDNRIAAGKSYGLNIYEATTGALKASWPLSVHETWPFWSPDGKQVATLSDHAVDVRDAATGKQLFLRLEHTQHVLTVAWNPDGKHLATATLDNQVHLWDCVTGNPILTLHGKLPGAIRSLHWSPDGMQLGLSSGYGQVYIWDATRGYEMDRARECLAVLEARLAANGQDREALSLRAGVNARLGAWDNAAADSRRFLKLDAAKSGVFQVGWWSIDASENDSASLLRGRADPFEAVAATASDGTEQPSTPTWYVAADDPNGYVPLAKKPLLYLTRFYASAPCQARLTFQINAKLPARIWQNGTAIDPQKATSIALSEGWNTLIVEVEKVPLSVDALLHPREGFYLRLERSRPGQ